MSNGLASLRRPRPSSVNNDEAQRLKRQLEERDRQLKEQAASLAEMENSLAELQILMAQNANTNFDNLRPVEGEDGDSSHLRAILLEKEDKIATMNADFDSHRADFRSTIDTLEMASTETERVYEQRVKELEQEAATLRANEQEVQVVSQRFKQFEDVVQELEEGLEDARRGEAEARSEVEFLRGEVERGHSELKRERDKAAAALKNADSAMSARSAAPDHMALEQRDDEIRGLKAIIHSLSAGDSGSPGERALASEDPMELAQLRDSMARLEREKSELQGLVDRKGFREEELEREIARMNRTSASSATVSASVPNGPSASSPNDIRDSVISTGQMSVRTLTDEKHAPQAPAGQVPARKEPTASTHRRQNTAVFVPAIADESIASSSVTSDTLWCEICETAGHDVLTCTELGNERTQDTAILAPEPSTRPEALASPLSRSTPSGAPPAAAVPRPLVTSPRREEPSRPPAEALPRPPEGDGPAAGKASGVIDMSRWCAMCERDGHESVDCPFEEDY